MEFRIRIRGFFQLAVAVLVTVLALCSIGRICYRFFVKQQSIRLVAARREKQRQFHFNFHQYSKLPDGYLLFTPVENVRGGNGRLVICDMNGRLIWSKVTRYASSDFRQWHICGRTIFSYFESETADTSDKVKVSYQCALVLLDSSLQEYRRIHLSPVTELPKMDGIDLDGHDVILLNEDHYFVFCNYPRHPSNIPSFLNPAPLECVRAPVIQEIQNGKKIWQWDAGDFPEFYANSFEDNKFYDTSKPADPIHMNSMALDPADSNLILSFRNLNQIVKINRRSGKIIWRLGGRNSDFSLNAEQIFSGQHDVTVTGPGPTLMLLDNGAIPSRKESRVLEIILDEKQKKVSSYSSRFLVERKAESQGSVSIVGENYLICGGVGNYISLVARNDTTKKMAIYLTQPSYRVFYVSNITGIPVTRVK
jgi:arylsulfate sulfotransferase